MDREIWFDKVLWSYMPCHWKGVAAMFAVTIPTVTATLLARHILGDSADWLEIPILLAGLLTLSVICKHHS